MSSISSVGGNSSWSQASTMRSRMPPPPDGEGAAAMFKKIDSDGSGGVDATELQTMFTDMASKSGNSSGTGNTPDASKMISEFDADGDGSLNQDELGKGMQSLMPPPNTMDFARQHSAGASGGCGRGGDASSSTSSTSEQTMDDLLSAIDTNQDGSIDKSELSTFKQVLSEQANSLMQTDSSSSSSSSASSDGSSNQNNQSSQTDTTRSTSMEELARMVIQRYAAMVADTAQQTSLSVAA